MLEQVGDLLGWSMRGRCQEVDPDIMFLGGAQAKLGKKVCRGCPVTDECLAYALANDIGYGVWGGMTAIERRRMRR